VKRGFLAIVGAWWLGSLVFSYAFGGGRSSGPPPSLPYYESSDLTPHWAPVAHRVHSFRLVTQAGTPLQETDLDGRIHVASFIFTRCPNLCPMLVTRLLRVQEAAREWPDVRVVSFSVTPTLDTPSVLAAFAREHGIDAERWWLATGDAPVIRRLARESYFANDSRAEDAGATDALLHTENVVLVDQQRRLRGVYNGTQPFEIERLLEDIRTLRKEGRS
jgi:protein SCO1/2